MTPSDERELLRTECATVLRPGGAALLQVSLQVGKGEALALVGPDDVGRATLLRVCDGALRPSEGRALIAGRDLATLSRSALRRARARLGFVPREPELARGRSALRSVLDGARGRAGLARALRLRTLPAGADVARAGSLLQRLGLGQRAEARVDALSADERRRLAIARALLLEPEALLADEPLRGLDPARAEERLELLLELARERGLALVLSLGDAELARRRLPRLVGLRAGRAAFDRPARQVGARELDELFEDEREARPASR